MILRILWGSESEEYASLSSEITYPRGKTLHSVKTKNPANTGTTTSDLQTQTDRLQQYWLNWA